MNRTHTRHTISAALLILGAALPLTATSLPTGVAFYSGLREYTGDLSALDLSKNASVDTTAGLLVTEQTGAQNVYSLHFDSGADFARYNASIAFEHLITDVIVDGFSLTDPTGPTWEAEPVRALEESIFAGTAAISLDALSTLGNDVDNVRIITNGLVEAPNISLNLLGSLNDPVALSDATGQTQLSLDALTLNDSHLALEFAGRRNFWGFGTGVVGSASISGLNYLLRAPTGYTLQTAIDASGNLFAPQPQINLSPTITAAGTLIAEAVGHTFGDFRVDITNAIYTFDDTTLTIPPGFTLRFTDLNDPTRTFENLSNVSLSLRPAPVPDPATLMLLLLALGGLWLNAARSRDTQRDHAAVRVPVRRHPGARRR